MFLSDVIILIQPQELACHVVQCDYLHRHPGGITLFTFASGLWVSDKASDEKVTVGRKNANWPCRSQIMSMDQCQGGERCADQWGMGMPMDNVLWPATSVE